MMAKPRLALILIPLIFLSSSLVPSYAFHFLITVLYMHPIHRFPISPSVLGKGPSIKYVTLFLMIFDPLPPPCHKLSQILDPLLKVCHTSEQKVNKQISRMETALNNYNCYYYILNNNKRPYIGCF